MTYIMHPFFFAKLNNSVHSLLDTVIGDSQRICFLYSNAVLIS